MELPVQLMGKGEVSMLSTTLLSNTNYFYYSIQ